jgi:hypothetical protein
MKIGDMVLSNSVTVNVLKDNEIRRQRAETGPQKH